MLHLKHEDPNIEQKYSHMMIQNTHVAPQSKETSNTIALLCSRQAQSLHLCSWRELLHCTFSSSLQYTSLHRDDIFH